MHRFHPLVFTLCLTLLVGCAMGHKKWPRPQTQEDTFSWRLVTAERQGPCLVVEGRLLGNYQNLGSVTVQYQKIGDDAGCRDCPFQADAYVELSPGDNEYEQIGPYVRLVVCGLDVHNAYKWQIIGHNIQTNLGNVNSDVVIIEPVQ